MSELSTTPQERSRKACSAVLQTMQDAGTGKAVAIALGVAESTVSRTKAELEPVLALVYQLGFKLVPADHVCVRREMYEAMTTIASAAMADEQTARKLVWEGQE